MPNTSYPQVEALELDLKAQATVMEGNILYEWSQITSAVGRLWRPFLDQAVANFRAAGCSERDIRMAQKNHIQREQLDIPASPPPEPAAAPAAAPAEAAKPQAKGLPSLEVKGKKKAAQ